MVSDPCLGGDYEFEPYHMIISPNLVSPHANLKEIVHDLFVCGSIWLSPGRSGAITKRNVRKHDIYYSSTEYMWQKEKAQVC